MAIKKSAKLGTPTVGIPFLLQLKTTIFKMMEKTSSTAGQESLSQMDCKLWNVKWKPHQLYEQLNFISLDVSTDDHFTFTPATAGTFFDGGANDQ